MEKFSPFALDVFNQKYAMVKGDGTKETWDEAAGRVARNVLKSVDASKALINDITEVIRLRKFIPGGRYLYSAGRSFHQVQNCLLLRAEDSREGWAELMHKSTVSLMSGAGIGIDYSDIRAEGKPIRKTGGTATGPLALMQMVNEAGRGIVQGGNRRSAIWAGLRWSHNDSQKFIVMKNWIQEVRDLKEKDFSFPATMDLTNISIQLDDDFFEAYGDEKNPQNPMAQQVYWAAVTRMLKTGEPGFSIDTGKNRKETLRNAPVCGETQVLTFRGYKPVSNIVGKPTTIWTGDQWAHNVVFKETNKNADVVKVQMSGGRQIRCDGQHPFLVETWVGAGKRRKLKSIDKIAASQLKPGDILHTSLPPQYTNTNLSANWYTMGYVYGDGSFTNNGKAAEITFCTPESKKCALKTAESTLISSINMEDGRGYIRAYFKTSPIWENRDKAIFPIETHVIAPEFAASFIAGLFDADGNWEPQQKRIRLSSKHEGFLRGVARLLEQYGILAGVSKAGFSTYGQAQTYQLVIMSEYARAFKAFIPCLRVKPELDEYVPYRASKIKVESVEPDGQEPVYCADVKVPEHSFMAEGVIISNCTEITSADDSDVCNLGSINLARIESLDDMKKVVELATIFLLAGTVYSDVPYPKVDQIRTKNRRLGLGLMGVHEWLLTHGKKYGADSELEEYLKIYATSGTYAHQWAKKWDLSAPVKTRAIAPTGTIGIIGETTTGIEPVFCVAYKRRYLKGKTWAFQYVIDPTAANLINKGVNPEHIEDAYNLAETVERRVAFQAWMQPYVDHSISSTINLPAWGTELNNESTVHKFGDMLIKHLPYLRGITCYPDGARGGQPLTTINYATAKKHVGEIFYETADVCEISGKGGSCGS